jgi:predicted RNA-binding Zn ribbon-like protein
MPLTELVELVNEWGTLPRRVGARGSAPGAGSGAPRELIVLADEVHPVFAADDPADQASMVTTLLSHTGVRPVLTAEQGALVEAWIVDDPAQARRAAAALALRAQLAEHPGRIGVCADRQCADVWVDTSPAGRRRFCCLTCQNRARAAAFRKRHGG